MKNNFCTPILIEKTQKQFQSISTLFIKTYFYLFIIASLFLALILTTPVSAATFGTNSLSQNNQENKLNTEFVLQGITIGSTQQEVIHTLGEPTRIDQSEYGFEWYIYNQDYTHYLQVGLEQGKVVALYTNSTDWYTAATGIGFGTTKKEVEQVYGQPLKAIKKGNTIFNYQDSGEEYGLYLLDDIYATIFYDIHQNHTVTAIQLMDKSTELSFAKFYGEPSTELQASFERQVFDLSNSVRVRNGQAALQWHEGAASTARKHSIDMVKRNFFEHNNPDGKSPFERMKADGISYKLASENIAAGQTSAIFVHESWMNSLGHRQNILGDFSHLGVGITFGGPFNIYYTQNFFTPMPSLELVKN